MSLLSEIARAMFADAFGPEPTSCDPREYEERARAGLRVIAEKRPEIRGAIEEILSGRV